MKGLKLLLAVVGAATTISMVVAGCGSSKSSNGGGGGGSPKCTKNNCVSNGGNIPKNGSGMYPYVWESRGTNISHDKTLRKFLREYAGICDQNEAYAWIGEDWGENAYVELQTKKPKITQDGTGAQILVWVQSGIGNHWSRSIPIKGRLVRSNNNSKIKMWSQGDRPSFSFNQNIRIIIDSGKLKRNLHMSLRYGTENNREMISSDVRMYDNLNQSQ